MLQIKKIFHPDEFIKIVNKIIAWPIEKIFDFAQNVYNSNGVGSIDTNDLISYLKSEYNGRTSKLLIMKDIECMLWYIENVKYKNDHNNDDENDINIKKFREIKKMIGKDYKDTSKIRDSDLIEKRTNNLFHKLES